MFLNTTTQNSYTVFELRQWCTHVLILLSLDGTRGKSLAVGCTAMSQAETRSAGWKATTIRCPPHYSSTYSRATRMSACPHVLINKKWSHVLGQCLA